MATKIRETTEAGASSNRNGHATRAGTGLDSIKELRSRRVLQKGIATVSAAARFSIAAAYDMLDGKITPQEASVLTTVSGRVLKAAELHLKHARGSNTELIIPGLLDESVE